eukprot:7152640-Lingulodinium_polyedra.AAC.1
MALCGPLHDQHAENAAEIRGPEASLSWYTAAAEGAWKEPLRKTVACLSDISILSFIGFHTSFSDLGKKASLADPLVQ